MKTIVVYYSRKGSNKYLAVKIAASLKCDIEEIRPRVDLFLLFLMNINPGIWPLKHKIAGYERVILCGPIWMGRFIPPLRSFIKKYIHKINKLVFVTCCGSTYEKKDEKFGHELVFREVKRMVNDRCTLCQAFPIVLVLPDDKKEDADAFMKTHLNDETFKGEIEVQFEEFLKILTTGSN